MAIQRFTWPTQIGESPDISYRVRASQFGDGYKQLVGDGPNNKVQSYPVTFTGTKSEVLEVMAFFDAHAGYTSFLWMTPLGDLALFTCAKPVPTPMGGGVFKISATFDQAFQP